MKLKQLPEDFRVEEINEFEIVAQGAYRLYLLEKKSTETFSLLNYLARQNKIPPGRIGIAGVKDKHGITRQYLSVPSAYAIRTLKENSFCLSFLGFVNDEIKLGSLLGNRFEITVRDIRKGELDGIFMKAKDVPVFGAPNYFDSQRFRSISEEQFIAKCVMRRDYEAAVKIYLTNVRFERADVKPEKKYILQNWNNFDAVCLNLKNKELLHVARAYQAGKSWLEAYKAINPNLRQMYLSAYQSYLWNECVKELLLCTLSKKCLYPIEYDLGKLLFFKNVAEQDIMKLPKSFQTLSDEFLPAKHEQVIVNKVLSRENVTIADFAIKKQTGNFFKTHERDVIVIPEKFEISKPIIDELNDRGKQNRFKIKLSFDLPKGSYATVITKRLFNR